MRLIFVFALVALVADSSISQNTPIPNRLVLNDQIPCRMDYPETVYLEDIRMTKDWVLENVLKKSGSGARFINEIESKTGKHITFVQTFEDIAVEDALIRLHFNHENKLLLVQKTISPSLTIRGLEGIESHNKDLRLLLIDGEFLVCERKLNTQNDGYDYWYNGELIHHKSGKLYFHGPDTTVHAQVFMINPLNSANVEYGDPYLDKDDADVAEINAERQWVTMPAHFENDTFYLRTQRYRITEVSDPKNPITKSVSDTFSYTRAQFQFEDVNAFYHITEFSKYIESIGVEAQLPDSLNIDAHAFGGTDRSAFTFTSNPLRVEFGEGGVDDAEDGEVVVHEFGHSISHTSSPSTVSGSEREAMEEGIADYLCKTYSLEYSAGDVNDNNVFSWDGHNEYWEGIKTGVSLRYPDHLTGNTNNDRAVWSTPLLCLRDKLGKDVADKLVLEHLTYQSTNTTMPSMANIMLLVDDALNSGENHDDIKNCFAINGILEGVNQPPTDDEKNLVLFNSLNFALGKGNMELLVPGERIKKVVIFNEIGQIQLTVEGVFNKILIESKDYSKGTYFIWAETAKYTESLRFVKLD